MLICAGTGNDVEGLAKDKPSLYHLRKAKKNN